MNKDMKILIVDDFSTMRRIIKNLLRDLGFNNTAEADDGTHRPADIAVGQFRFSGDRLEHAGHDRHRPAQGGARRCQARKLPVLMVTAEQKRDQIIEAAQAGVNGYIVKPFTAITLKEKIDKIFERLEATA